MQTNLWDNQIAVKKIQIIYLTLSKYSLLSKKNYSELKLNIIKRMIPNYQQIGSNKTNIRSKILSYILVQPL